VRNEDEWIEIYVWMERGRKREIKQKKWKESKTIE